MEPRCLLVGRDQRVQNERTGRNKKGEKSNKPPTVRGKLGGMPATEGAFNSNQEGLLFEDKTSKMGAGPSGRAETKRYEQATNIDRMGSPAG